MDTFTSSLRSQYAVIQMRESHGGIERLILAYPDERTLRELLAPRSILATGFSSPDEAKEIVIHGKPGKVRFLFNLLGLLSVWRHPNWRLSCMELTIQSARRLARRMRFHFDGYREIGTRRAVPLN